MIWRSNKWGHSPDGLLSILRGQNLALDFQQLTLKVSVPIFVTLLRLSVTCRPFWPKMAPRERWRVEE